MNASNDSTEKRRKPKGKRGKRRSSSNADSTDTKVKTALDVHDVMRSADEYLSTMIPTTEPLSSTGKSVVGDKKTSNTPVSKVASKPVRTGEKCTYTEQTNVGKAAKLVDANLSSMNTNRRRVTAATGTKRVDIKKTRKTSVTKVSSKPNKEDVKDTEKTNVTKTANEVRATPTGKQRIGQTAGDGNHKKSRKTSATKIASKPNTTAARAVSRMEATKALPVKEVDSEPTIKSRDDDNGDAEKDLVLSLEELCEVHERRTREFLDDSDERMASSMTDSLVLQGNSRFEALEVPRTFRRRKSSMDLHEAERSNHEHNDEHAE